MWNKFILREGGAYDPRYSGGVRNGADANSEFGVRNSEFGIRKQLVLNKGGNWLAVRTARGGFPDSFCQDIFVFIPFDVFIEFYLKLW